MSEGASKEFPVQWISKEARYRIIELLLSTRSVTELSRILGVSPTAIRKYIKRASYPSDNVLARVFESLASYERDAIIEIVVNDLITAISMLYNAVEDKHKELIKSKLREVTGL
ncbi:MAG: helix-turn-helix domain-containing protein [Desulfurococcaceae archaeon]